MTDSDLPFGTTPPQRPAILGDSALVSGAVSTVESVDVVRRGKGMRAGLVGALLVVSGAGGFAVNSALTAASGPQTPEAAMEEFFSALADEDIVGILETVLPSERESLFDPTLAIVEQLERLELVEAGTDLDTFGTLDFEIDGLQVTSELLAEGFAVVQPSAGTISVSGTTDDVPVLAAVGDWYGEEPEDLTTGPMELSGQDSQFVAVEYEGAWYLSLGYSVAEQSRGELALPTFGAGPLPVGGETPAAAVENFIQAGVDFDLEGMLTQLDPEEMRVLYDYSQIFLPDAQAELDEVLTEFRAQGFELSVSGLSFSSEERRGRTVVFLDGAHFEADLGGDTVTADFDGECTALKYAGYDGSFEIDTCDLAALGDSLEEMGFVDSYDFGLDSIEFDRSGITVVERDGRWFISVIPSALYSALDVLTVLEPSDMESISEGYSSMFKEWGNMFNESNSGFYIEEPLYED